jgi:hypothetical protein
VSFAEWAGRWQETTTNLRPNTRALHGYLLRRLLLPASGDTALADMASRDAAIAAASYELIEAASTLAKSAPPAPSGTRVARIGQSGSGKKRR